MKTVNTVELKNHTNQLLHHVWRGHPVVVTHHGKPRVAMIPVTEQTLEGLILEYSPAFRQMIEEAEADVRAGRVVTWREFLAHERSSPAAA